MTLSYMNPSHRDPFGPDFLRSDPPDPNGFVYQGVILGLAIESQICLCALRYGLLRAIVLRNGQGEHVPIVVRPRSLEWVDPTLLGSF